MPTIIEHPGYGSDTCSDAGINPPSKCSLKSGFVCEECGESVLAFKKPKQCEEHED